MACQAGLDVNLRGEGAVDRALVGDLQQSQMLLLTEHTREFHVAVDVVEQTVGGFTLLAVGGVNSRMPEPNRHGVERPLLASGVHRHRHRHARSQRREQKVVRVGSCIGPSGPGGLVSREPVSSGCYLLRESGCAAVDRDDPRFRQLTAHFF